MQFRVLIPDECEAGQTVRIHLTDGTEANVTIPKVLLPGDSFIFDLPTHQLGLGVRPVGGGDSVTVVPATQINDDDNNNLMTATASVVVTNNNSHDGDDDDDDDDDNNNDDDHNNNGSNNNQKQNKSSSSYARRTFLEREIIDCQDFILALSVGLLVGTAIVIGFLFGVLHVTSSYPIDKYGNLILINHTTNDDNNNNNNNNINDILNSPAPSPEKIETIEVVNEAMQLLKQ